MFGELLGGAGGVGAHQHGHVALFVRLPQMLGNLSERLFEDQDVVGGGVAACVTWSQQFGDRLTSTPGAVIHVTQQRMEPEPAFPGRRRGFLVRVRCHQRGIQINHHLTSRPR